MKLFESIEEKRPFVKGFPAKKSVGRTEKPVSRLTQGKIGPLPVGSGPFGAIVSCPLRPRGDTR